MRNPTLFYRLFLIDTSARKATQLCPFVRSGIMHRDFQKYLKADGLGIDYTMLEDYDTATVLHNFLFSQHPYWKSFCERAIESKKSGQLQECLNSAQRIHLDQAQPELIKRIREAIMDRLH